MLSALDSEMGAYWHVQQRLDWGMSGRQQIDDDAKTFLDGRTKCGPNVQCLQSHYTARIDSLKQSVDDWLKNAAQ